MATQSSILARIPWTEKPAGYSPWGRKESDLTERLALSLPSLHKETLKRYTRIGKFGYLWEWQVGNGADRSRMGGHLFTVFFFFFFNNFPHLFVCGGAGSSLPCGFSLVALSEGYSLFVAHKLLIAMAYVWWSLGSSPGSVIVGHGLSCSAAHGIFPEKGSNPCLLHCRWILYH